MKITFVSHKLSTSEEVIKAHDDSNSENISIIYNDGRGICNIWENSYLKFDFFKHLRNLCKKTSSRIDVFEGGCGRGNALVDLKRGVTYRGNLYEGLGETIRTTGATLSTTHSNFAKHIEKSCRVDEMIIGPIKHHRPDRQYDFIFDHFGIAFYFPFDAIPVYGKLLKKGSFCFVRLDHGSNGYIKEGRDYDVGTLFEENNLSIVRCRGIHYPEDNIDYIAVKH